MEVVKAVDPTESGNCSKRLCCGNAFFLYEVIMKKQKFHLYHIDMKYIRDMAKADDNVMSISPQTGKSSRPFVGIIVMCSGIWYCIPFSSPKEKHKTMKNDKDFSRMFDKRGKLIGVLNFNNMIPVYSDVISEIDIRLQQTDDSKTKAYKGLLNDQLDWCNANLEAIGRKANKLYQLILNGEGNHLLKKRCCDFVRLEKVMQKWLSK